MADLSPRSGPEICGSHLGAAGAKWPVHRATRDTLGKRGGFPFPQSHSRDGRRLEPMSKDDRMAARRPLRTAVITLALALSLAACDRAGGEGGPPERGDKAVATVDGKT